MENVCPSCGAETFPGTRFCRRCGAPVREAAVGTGNVSPQASTVPLRGADEARATEGLAGAEGRAPGETSRVSRAELEHLLRQQELDGHAQHDTHAALQREGRGATHDPEATLATPAVTRPEAPAASDFDEELTVTVPRDFAHGGGEATADFDSTHDFEATVPTSPETRQHTAREHTAREAQGVEDVDGLTAREASHPPGDASTPPGGVPPQGAPRRAGAPASSRRRWPLVAALCGAALLLTVALAWVGWRMFRRPSLDDLPAQATPSTPVPEAAQRFDEKMAEAEALLAQGNMDGAVARLREANEIDPANTRAHRRLGELLLAAGARREAIEEFRALTRNAPDDFNAWRQLASAQFSESLYRDAAESYRRALALAGESADPNDLLAYADALRLSGRADEARTLYEKVLATPDAAAAAAARQRLSELAQATPTPAPTPRTGETPEAQAQNETASDLTPPAPAQPTPTPAAPPQATPTPAAPQRAEGSTPAERYRRGVGLWSSNRPAALDEMRAAAAAGNPDAHYYLGLAYVEGRNPHSLKRAEVVAALEHFQKAQRGQHAQQARRHAQQLEKEFDRFRKQ